MPMTINREEMAAITVIESFAAYRGELDKILAWPDLKPESRLVAFAAVVMMQRDRAANVLVADVARAVGMSPDDALKVCRKRNHPLYWAEDDDGHVWFSASHALAYGEA